MKRPEVINDLPLFDEILNSTSQESKLYVTRSLAIANQIIMILEKKGMKQKDLALLLGKKEAEVSRWLAGFHNFTIKSIAKIESALGEQLIFTESEIRAGQTSPAAIAVHSDLDVKEVDIQAFIKMKYPTPDGLWIFHPNKPEEAEITYSQPRQKRQIVA
ncbi:helix-turn-helix domain-containing protein [Parapedobacter koreensis]|uniref:Helix-turn-helix n=1 Tax=Parapedobacter koreensis TaxID=332977 RepID=A0A1H7U4M6_9SPHI|nr:helix-turn-helix transcriptional regulator [Parapedobacter koreensis]SEL91744.1 Helix-turn-helix [Parapedobacter koreensis]